MLIGRKLKTSTLVATVAALIALTAYGSTGAAASAATCPNEPIRSEQGPVALALPECRAYELVSPGGNPYLTEGLNNVEGRAAAAGSALAYATVYPAADSETSSETWLSRRTAGGWTLTGIDPQATPTNTKLAECTQAVAFSENLDADLLWAGGDRQLSPREGQGECQEPVEEIVSGEPRGYSNLYLRQNGEPYVLLNSPPSGALPANATYQAASSDLTHVVFSENAQLTPESPSGFNLFEWVNGHVRLVGVLPDGDPVPARLGAATQNWGFAEGDSNGGGSTAGLAPVSHAVSANGERIFFEAEGHLYLRENAGQAPAADPDCMSSNEPGLACTLELDVSLGKDESGGGVFQFASREGTRVFFTSDHKLLGASNAQAGKPDLYEYNVETEEVSDLNNGAGVAANVRGISGGSDDGSSIYFVARAAVTGSQENARGEVAQAEEPNLYLARDLASGRTVTFIATLSPWAGGRSLDRADWWETESLRTSWSPSGRYLLFSSYRPLTGADNTPVNPAVCESGSTCNELYLYDADTENVSCVSCSQSGGKPEGETNLLQARLESSRFGRGPRYGPRAVLDTGQVFFQTPNALSPSDVNGAVDVYQYDSGELSLLSGGFAVGGSGFVDASANGVDVFVATSSALVRADTDGGVPSIYDVRTDGGFSEPPVPAEPCAGEGTCRLSTATPPRPVTPVTTGVGASGNFKPKPKSQACKHGFVRHGKRCVKRPKHKHKKSAHKKKQADRPGGNH